MGILISSATGAVVLTMGLIGFLWLASKKFNWAMFLVLFLLPIYLVRFRILLVPFSVLEALIWILFAVWLAQKGYKNIGDESKGLILPSLVILVGAILSVLFSRDLVTSAGILKGWFLAPMAFGLIIISKTKEKEVAKKNLLALFLSSSLVAIAAFVYFIFNRVTFDGRLSAFFLSPNHLAMYLAPGFLVGLWLFKMFFANRQRIIIVILLIFLAAALFLTYSYLAWLVVLLVVLLCLIMEFKGRMFNRRVFVISCYLLAVLVLFLSFSQLNSEKMTNLLHSPRSSFQSRLMIWRAAWEIGKDHPIFGVGPAMFQSYYLEYQKYFLTQYLEWAVPHPHNIFLAFWLETGLVGLVGFVWLLVSFFKKTLKALKSKNQLALVLMMLMVYIILHGLADTTYFKNDLSVVFWAIVALSSTL